MLDTILQLAGRAHPLLLHLPIGMLAALVCLELLALLELIKLDARVRVAFAWLVTLSAAASVATGLLLEREPSYAGGQTLDLHKWLGIGVGICTLLIALCLCSKLTRKLYPFLLLAAVSGIIPAGHLGATMTHGEGFLTEPLFPRQSDPVRGSGSGGSLTPAATSGIYPEQIAPIFDRYCVSCHSDSKKKGGLTLCTPDGIQAGGKTGSAIEPGDPESSEIIFRLRLPATDRDHMPPKAKPQPDAAAIRLIEQWIAAGSPFQGGELLPPGSGASTDREASHAETLDNAPDVAAVAVVPSPIPAEALAALRGQQIHAEIIDPAQNLLWISFDGVAAIDDETTARLLAPLAPFIADLSLAGTKPGARTITQLANMPAIRRLSLARTRLNSGELATLAGAPFPSLEELNLSASPLDESAAELLATRFPKLSRIFLWHTGLSEAAIADLRARRPALALELDEPAVAPLETEPPPTFSGDAPPPQPIPVPAAPPPPPTAK